VQPGEILREDFLRPGGMSVNALAKAPQMNQRRRARRSWSNARYRVTSGAILWLGCAVVADSAGDLRSAVGKPPDRAGGFWQYDGD